MQIKIALADDHQLVRDGIKMLLENFSEFKVTIDASDGQELLMKMSTAKSLPHIAMIDVTMVGMDGYETTAKLNQLYPEVKVVALSVHDDLRTVNRMIESGAHGYLLKDSSPQVMKETLLMVYEKGYHYDRLIMESIMKAKDLASSRNQKTGMDFLSLLTSREMEFIKCCCSEKTYKEIADDMNVSVRTVDGYRESVFSKLDLKSRTGLVLYAIQRGIYNHEKI